MGLGSLNITVDEALLESPLAPPTPLVKEHMHGGVSSRLVVSSEHYSADNVIYIPSELCVKGDCVTKNCEDTSQT